MTFTETTEYYKEKYGFIAWIWGGNEGYGYSIQLPNGDKFVSGCLESEQQEKLVETLKDMFPNG